MHTEASFLTVTYDDEHFPADASVHKSEVQLFMKRLRKWLGSRKVRYFACGEYGGKLRRPHYHIVLFGYEFLDAEPWRRTATGNVIYRSQKLETIWGLGHAYTAPANEQSMGYVARYSVKKFKGSAECANAHYEGINPYTGQLCQLTPEFALMSSRPGIGGSWYDEFSVDCFPSDFVVIDGRKHPVPRYYLNKLGISDEYAHFETLKSRKEKADKHHLDQTPERLAVREEVQQLKADRLQRTGDDNDT